MIKVFEGFAGYGGWLFGLKQCGIEYEVIGFSEIDKYAIQCYNRNHYKEISQGEYSNLIFHKNYGDITTINPIELPDFDLLCASPPCQAFSVAGKNQGKDDERGRGRLFENTINIMRIKKPRYAIYENVKGLTFKKHKEYFEYLLQSMVDCGYFVKWKILNTRDYGVPQNRERVFIICFREKEDFDNFEFPEKEKLKIFVKDILEEEVDDRYKLSENALKLIVERLKTSYKSKFNPEISNTLRTNYGGSFANETYVTIYSTQPRSENRPSFVKAKEEGKPYPGGYGTLSKEDGTSYCLDTSNTQAVSISKNKRILKVLENPTIKSNLTYELTGDTPSGISRQGDRIFNLNSHSPTINCTQKEYLFSNPNELNIRKLTPKECFRLQGFLKDEINLDGLSNSQCYKLAGNGLSINVVSKIFKEIFKNIEDKK